MKRNITIILGVVMLVGLAFWGFKNNQSTTQNINPEKLQVVASFYPLYFFASSIGGDKAQVKNITPAGAEPHDFEPSAQDLVRIEKSQLIILNGGGLEAWKDNVQKNSNPKKTTLIIAGEDLATQKMSQDGQLETDPHVWLAPPLAEKMVDRIAQGFFQADPKNKDYYAVNAEELKNKLTKLDAQYRSGLSNCAKRDIITAHSAFGYLAAAYGLNQVSITGLSPDAEPSPSQLADITKFARENEVKYIFFEDLTSPKLAQTIATEVGAQTLVLNPLEGLSIEDAAQGKDYITVMQGNLTNLRTALECRM